MIDVYKLKVTPVEQVCFFELTWGKGQQLTAQLPYPTQLETVYKSWQRIYLNYYQSALRGQAVTYGQIVAKTDWQGQLVQAEAKLVYEFNQWLRNGALFEIRRVVGQSALTTHSASAQRPVVKGAAASLDLLITCDSELSRLPWETWEIGAEFGSSQQSIRIARLPMNIHESVSHPLQANTAARVLVILGDDTGLNFSAELSAITQQLKRSAKITVIGWQPGDDEIALKQTIGDAIQAESGWDMLLFFGHSNEASAVGGRIAIAPNTTLSMRELIPSLRKAKSRGLKFALFNSCKGIDIATTLIDIGLNQVAIMREPIHNRVAQVFFIQFMQSLACFDDVHTAIQKATHALHSNSNLTYPSAYLVPSLFRHSDAMLFRLRPLGWQSRLTPFLPRRRWQSVALAIITGISFYYPATESLIAPRLWSQALYRDKTQPSTLDGAPPILLIQIDAESVREGIPSGDPHPMDRTYLAQLVDKLSALDTQVVGIDYLLDRPQAENDPRFAESVRHSVEQGTSIVFGTELVSKQEVNVHKNVASLDWVLQGYTNTYSAYRWYLRIPQYGDACLERCPFSYLLALTGAARQSPIAQSIMPNLDSDQDLRRALMISLKGQSQDDYHLSNLYQLRLPIVASLSRWWKQRWLHPLIDFSIPSDQVYDQISAYRFLDTSVEQLKNQFEWQNQVVIIASGGYDEAGKGGTHQDYVSPPPLAIRHWYRQQGNSTEKFTGGEANAYAAHHFLKHHYIVPIPDSWCIGIAMVAGSGIAFYFYRRQFSHQRQLLILFILSLASGWISLHAYITLLVLLPWLFPTAIIWVFCLPSLLSSSLKKPSYLS